MTFRSRLPRPRRFVTLSLLILMAACGPKLPPSYSAQVHRASNAHQLLQEVEGISGTVINLNTLPSGMAGHISDDDARLVRDFALAIADGAGDYVSDGKVAGILSAWDTLQAHLSQNAKLSPDIKVALALIYTQIQLIQGLTP